MAPEQAGGKNREIGPAADIYSLGAILYELLVGRPPFRAGNPIDTIRQVIEQEPVPPRQLEPRVPHDLETICLKCLEKDPSRRFDGAMALADDLRRFVEGDPIQARPTPAWERAWKWGKRRKALVALLAVSTLAVLSMVLFIVWHNVSLRGKLDVALAEERRAKKREHDALEERRLTLVQQEGQKLFDGARVAVAAGDWTGARLDLEKALTTIGTETRFGTLKDPAEALLKRVEQELRVEADRKASRARLQSFGDLRDEAQFLGTLYTGMDLAANLQAARDSVLKALAVYGVRTRDDAPSNIRRLPRRPAEGRGPGGLLPAPADPRRDRGPVRRHPETAREGSTPANGPGLPGAGPSAGRATPGLSPAAGTLPGSAGRRGGGGRRGKGGAARPSSTWSITS